MRIEKVEKEKSDLVHFLNLLGLVDIEFTKSEAPDFDVFVNNSSVGIELTDFRYLKKHSDLVLGVKSTMESIKTSVEDEINSSFKWPVLLNYSLRKPITRIIRKPDKLKIVNFLINHLKLKEVEGALNDQFFRFEFKYNRNQNEFIEKVNLSGSPQYVKSRVTNNDFYLMGKLPVEKIVNIVKEKFEKIDFERNSANWLVIFFDFGENSDGIIDDEVLSYELPEFGFDRVFLVERFNKKLHEMKNY